MIPNFYQTVKNDAQLLYGCCVRKNQNIQDEKVQLAAFRMTCAVGLFFATLSLGITKLFYALVIRDFYIIGQNCSKKDSEKLFVKIKVAAENVLNKVQSAFENQLSENIPYKYAETEGTLLEPVWNFLIDSFKKLEREGK